ncbi:glycosyltransferase family 39 protein [Microcoleus sp. LEGE 07076]|uniref:ArnT family glycosyltransferase n=1 Tax=Microcoleus sp. LEGE 07076 TaxID=915322 RepID=UPI00187F0B93|nr:glycosyltransferase family 39 protein [Microcoleus sp. LEGE 07076]MBE9185180.1 glycosyltransferase family 39 protein [Microcoleus sp. LEGE 07076]
MSKILPFSGGKPKTRLNDIWTDKLWMLALLLAAVLIFGLNLGGAALRDWDEGIAAQVSREIWGGNLNWLYPTISSVPYLNKPPLIHWLIGLCFANLGVSELTARLVPAMLTATSVPMLYAIGRELFPRRSIAIFSALVYLTLLPVVRHGRLAMLDGAVLCFLLVSVWCLLRSRRDLRYALGAGIGFGLICLTKGVMLGLLLGAIGLVFLVWDTPRLLTSGYLWGGLAIGTFPVAAWYFAQWLHYGQYFINANLLDQSFRRIWQPVGNHKGPPWYYLLEILESAWPWQLFYLQGLYLSWENRNFPGPKLVLVWSGLYLLAISVMNTKLPWYVLPVYPALALAVGSYLAEVWEQMSLAPEPIKDEAEEHFDAISLLPHPAILAVVAAVAVVGCAYFSGLVRLGGQIVSSQQDIQLMLIFVALTMTMAAVLLHRKDRQFLLVLIWGTYVALLVFVASDNWVWELAEDYPVKPIAEIVREGTPIGQEVFTSHRFPRPSLNFYSQRQVIVADAPTLKQKWQSLPQPYFLLEKPVLKHLALENAEVVKTAEDWVLVTRK